MSADRENLRTNVFDVLQASAAEDPDIEGAVLVGFLLLAEWQAPDGAKWMSKVSGDHAAELPGWRERMFAYEMAFHWRERDGTEEEIEPDDNE